MFGPPGSCDSPGKEGAIEKPYPAGVDLIRTGKCPRAALNSMACMFCPFGHMTECHYPMTCEEAQCSHCDVGEGGS